MKMLKKSWILAFALVSSSCALFGPRIEPYPSGIMFPVVEETRLTVEGKINGLVAGADGSVYLSSDHGKIIRVDPAARRILWEFSTANPVTEPVLAVGARVYAVDSGGVIYCLSPEGEPIWENKAGGKISTPLAEKEGRVYFGLESGDFICLRGEDGGKAWSFNAGSAAATEAVFWEGSAVFGSQDGKFHVLGSRGKLVSEIQTGLKLEKYLGLEGNRLFFGSGRNDICCLNLPRKKNPCSRKKAISPGNPPQERECSHQWWAPLSALYSLQVNFTQP